MRLKLKEDAKEWRKATLLSSLGIGMLSTVLRWRRILPINCWLALLALLAVIVMGACLRPRWFRGYYRFSSRMGFYFTRLVGYVILSVLFVLVVTPLGWALRLSGKDFLELKPRRNASTCWHKAKESTSLDRLF